MGELVGNQIIEVPCTVHLHIRANDLPYFALSYYQMRRDKSSDYARSRPDLQVLAQERPSKKSKSEAKGQGIDS